MPAMQRQRSLITANTKYAYVNFVRADALSLAIIQGLLKFQATIGLVRLKRDIA